MTKLQYTKKNKAQKTNTKTKSFRKLRKARVNKKLSKQNNKRKCGCRKTKKIQKGGKSFLQSISKAFTFGKVNNILQDIKIKLLELIDDYYKTKKNLIKSKTKPKGIFIKSNENKNKQNIRKQNLKKLIDEINNFKEKTIPNVLQLIKEQLNLNKQNKTTIINNIKTNLKTFTIINEHNITLLTAENIKEKLLKEPPQQPQQPQQQQQQQQQQQPQQQPQQPQQPPPQPPQQTR